MLKLIKSRKINRIGVNTIYEYGSFTIHVLIEDGGSIEIEAVDKKREIVIRSVNARPAVMTIEEVFMVSIEEISDFMKRLEEAKELLLLIQNKFYEN